MLFTILINVEDGTVQSDASSVSEYLNEVPEERLKAITRIRQLCRQHLADFDESMQYGMPSYSRDGTVEVAFASQKNNISLYILNTDVLNIYRNLFPKSAIGKGCIRYRNPDKIDFEIVEEMLVKTSASTGEVC